VDGPFVVRDTGAALAPEKERDFILRQSRTPAVVPQEIGHFCHNFFWTAWLSPFVQRMKWERRSKEWKRRPEGKT
jgi:hypothetical protein